MGDRLGFKNRVGLDVTGKYLSPAASVNAAGGSGGLDDPNGGQIHHFFHGKTVRPGMHRQPGAGEQRADQHGFFHHALQEIEGDVARLKIGEDEHVGVIFEFRKGKVFLPANTV